MVERHAVHILGRIVGIVKIMVLFGQKIAGIYLGFVDHFKSIHRTDLGTDSAAFAAIKNSIDVHCKTVPGNALGRLFEDLEIVRRFFRDGFVRNRGMNGRIRT